MYNGTTSGFDVKSWRHTTLWTAWIDGEHSVAHGGHRISYILLRKDAFVSLLVRVVLQLRTFFVTFTTETHIRTANTHAYNV